MMRFTKPSREKFFFVFNNNLQIFSTIKKRKISTESSTTFLEIPHNTTAWSTLQIHKITGTISGCDPRDKANNSNNFDRRERKKEKKKEKRKSYPKGIK